MLSRPLIVGAKGGMGRRYAAICKFLGVNALEVDVCDIWPSRGKYDGIIIATPTFMHIQHIRQASNFGVPILSEKPLGTNLREVLDLCDDAQKDDVKLAMVNQYAYLVPEICWGDTRYNYFRHGSDSLAWDCINILGIARDFVSLAETSPIWNCTINGHDLNLSDMDNAYIQMIERWLSGMQDGIDYIRKAHLKVEEYLRCHPS